MNLPPGWSQDCICGRTFTVPHAYTNHSRLCKKAKTRLSSALDKARQIWQANKHRKTEAAQPEAPRSREMEEVVQPEATSPREAEEVTQPETTGSLRQLAALPLDGIHQQVGSPAVLLSASFMFFFSCLSERRDLHGRSPPIFSRTSNTPRTLPTSEALSRYSTCTSSRTSPSISSGYASLKCNSAPISATPSACLTGQKYPQIHAQCIWAFPTILRSSFSGSRSWGIHHT